MPLTIEEINRLLKVRGQQQYGRETVSQTEHALQCAMLAEQAGETPNTVVAALLHDLGHLLAAERDHRSDDAQDRDDLHQYVAIPFLRGLLPDAVLEPIRMHVDAKRCLCTIDAGYWDTLSPASKRSLELQGGAMTFSQSLSFMSLPFAEEAIRLRRYDDLAKVTGLETPSLDHFMHAVRQCAIPSDVALYERLSLVRPRLTFSM